MSSRMRRLFIAVAVTAGLSSSIADAAPLSVVELHARVSSTDLGEVRRAVSTWRSIDDVALDDVDALIAALSVNRPPADELVAALVRLRDASPAPETPDALDLAGGVARLLGGPHNRADVVVAEHILLLRLLENVGTVDAARRMAALLAMDGTTWMYEARRIRLRMGMRLAPWFVLSQNDPRSVVRTWARAGVEQLGLADAPRAIAQARDPSTLAALLVAYGTIRDMNAMRVTGAYLNSDKAIVRNAARDAIQRYGRNSIWVLRDAYARSTQRDADLTLSARDLAAALFATLDEERIASARHALAEADAALATSDFQRAFDSLEAIAIDHPGTVDEAELSNRYERVAAAAEDAESDNLAEAAWNRVRWTASDPAKVTHARQRSLALRARSSASVGIADAEQLEATRVPGVPPRLRAVYDVVTGEAAKREESRKRLALGGLALAFLGLGASLWPRRQRPPKAATQSATA